MKEKRKSLIKNYSNRYLLSGFLLIRIKCSRLLKDNELEREFF